MDWLRMMEVKSLRVRHIGTMSNAQLKERIACTSLVQVKSAKSHFSLASDVKDHVGIQNLRLLRTELLSTSLNVIGLL